METSYNLHFHKETSKGFEDVAKQGQTIRKFIDRINDIWNSYKKRDDFYEVAI